MKIENIKGSFITWGFWRGFYYCLMSLLKPFIMVYQVHLREHSPNPKLPELENGFEIRIMSHEELLKYCDDPELNLEKDKINEAFARGEICVAALYNGDIVSYVWRSFTATPHMDGVWVDFKKGYRFGYKAFTRPKFRKKRLQHAVTLFTDKLMLERGISQGIGVVATHNYASLISDAKRGNECIGYAGYFKLFGKIIPFRTNGAKKHGFRFFQPKQNST